VLENPARLANHVTEFEHNWLQMRRDPHEAGSLHRTEQSVALRSSAWLALGHNSFFKTPVMPKDRKRRRKATAGA
jgi:hypothetical protein